MQELNNNITTYEIPYQSGNDTGFKAGYDTGFKAGYDTGFKAAYDTGFKTGYDTGFKTGYDTGFKTGYDTGIKETSIDQPIQQEQKNKIVKPMLNSVAIMNKSGKHLKKIQMGEQIHEDDENSYDKNLCLGPIFKNIHRPRVAFGHVDTAYVNFYYIYKKPKISINLKYESDVLTIPYDINNNTKNQEINEIMKKLRKDAQYGDLESLETKTDKKIRKGYDIDLTNREIQKIIGIENELIRELEKLFSDNMKMYNIMITPYKINIYEKGDFFEPHTDSPEKNLLGTIVFHVSGDYDCMMVENTIWTKDHGNVLMFYTDVLHQVNPVKSNRQTITFKVWSRCDTTNNNEKLTENPEYRRIIKELAYRVPADENFSVLLQNGYIFDNVFVDTKTENIYQTLTHNLKGNDQTIYDIALILGYNIRFVPVIVENRTKINRHDQTFNESDSDSEAEWVDAENYTLGGQAKIKVIDTYTYSLCEGNPEEINNSLNIYSAGKKMLCALYGISKTEAKILHDKMYDLNISNIYYMGLGYKIGSHKRRNMLIGNQCTGSAKDNVYLNIMMCCYK